MPNISLGTVALMTMLLAGLMVLSGCVTRRPPQDFACARLIALSEPGHGSQLVRDIQRDAFAHDVEPPNAQALFPAGSLDQAIVSAVGDGAKNARSAGGRDILLLSGGGQWGAYGAGMFEALHRRRPDSSQPALENIGIITGISTGSLQTLLLMVALDPARDDDTRTLAMQRLVAGYSPARERDIVRNTSMWGVPLFGSQAGTGPLRQLIRRTLHPSEGSSLIEAIEKSTIDGFIGFVEADTGDFRYVHVNTLIRGLQPEAAVECLTAAAMASSAMPVFHQQLRVHDGDGMRTLYDGGARRSAFFDRAMEQLDRSIRSRLDGATAGAGADYAATYRALAPTVYVVRNGPTVRARDDALNGRAGVIASGKRGYDLLVNESEVSAIAALRLYNPYGPILVTTADQSDAAGEGSPCLGVKGDQMFNPEFMTCLRQLGAAKVARRDNGDARAPWWPLSPLEARPADYQGEHK